MSSRASSCQLRLVLVAQRAGEGRERMVASDDEGEQQHDQAQCRTAADNGQAVVMPHIGQGELRCDVVRRHAQVAGQIVHDSIIGGWSETADVGCVGDRVSRRRAKAGRH